MFVFVCFIDLVIPISLIEWRYGLSAEWALESYLHPLLQAVWMVPVATWRFHEQFGALVNYLVFLLCLFSSFRCGLLLLSNLLNLITVVLGHQSRSLAATLLNFSNIALRLANHCLVARGCLSAFGGRFGGSEWALREWNAFAVVRLQR